MFWLTKSKFLSLGTKCKPTLNNIFYKTSNILHNLGDFFYGNLECNLKEDDFRSGKHVFIFGVWGRTSTTAIQRILNSSGEICIWGEPGDYLVDDYLVLLNRLINKNTRSDPERKRILSHSFKNNDHSINYAMAFPDLQPSIDFLWSSFQSMLPSIQNIKRIGFKDISVRNIETLDLISSIFLNSTIVYLFRNPEKQWVSVKEMAWERTSNLENFLHEYERLAKIYLTRGGIFMESSSLYNKECVIRLCTQLELSGFDQSLLGDGVYSAPRKQPLIESEVNIIKNSKALQLYHEMKSREMEWL